MKTSIRNTNTIGLLIIERIFISVKYSWLTRLIFRNCSPKSSNEISSDYLRICSLCLRKSWIMICIPKRVIKSYVRKGKEKRERKRKQIMNFTYFSCTLLYSAQRPWAKSMVCEKEKGKEIKVREQVKGKMERGNGMWEGKGEERSGKWKGKWEIREGSREEKMKWKK